MQALFGRYRFIVSPTTACTALAADFAAADTGIAAVTYEPDEESILADLLPRGVSTQLFAALLENAASEQGARMSAMDNATRNAGDMMDRWLSRWAANVARYANLECVKLILPWSTAAQRFCTAELKSQVIAREMRRQHGVVSFGRIRGVTQRFHAITVERRLFVELLKNPLTQARIKHMLDTGKPLRN